MHKRAGVRPLDLDTFAMMHMRWPTRPLPIESLRGTQRFPVPLASQGGIHAVEADQAYHEAPCRACWGLALGPHEAPAGPNLNLRARRRHCALRPGGPGRPLCVRWGRTTASAVVLERRPCEPVAAAPPWVRLLLRRVWGVVSCARSGCYGERASGELCGFKLAKGKAWVSGSPCQWCHASAWRE